MEDSDKVLFDSFVASGTPYSEQAFRLSLQSNILYDDDMLREFLASALRRNLRIAVVTSGGTIAPLERSCVRFVDNFSTGTRGATGTEFFLHHTGQDGGQYAVIFVHRKGSVLPFTRHVNAQKLAESCELNAAGNVVLNDDGVQEDLRNLISVKDRLFAIPFVSVSDYLLTLRSLSSSIRNFGTSALLFLAAAVSDFHIPYGDLPTHKIQSGSGDLVLRLQKVPKMLGIISQQWVPNAFVVSFKLETDQTLLGKKSSQALDKYQVDAVVGNLLHTRYDEVIVASRTGSETIARDLDVQQIESLLVSNIIDRHSRYIAKCGSACKGSET